MNRFVITSSLLSILGGSDASEEKPKPKAKPKPKPRPHHHHDGDDAATDDFTTNDDCPYLADYSYCGVNCYHSAEQCGTTGPFNYGFCSIDVENKIRCYRLDDCDLYTDMCTTSADCATGFACAYNCDASPRCYPTCDAPTTLSADVSLETAKTTSFITKNTPHSIEYAAATKQQRALTNTVVTTDKEDAKTRELFEEVAVTMCDPFSVAATDYATVGPAACAVEVCPGFRYTFSMCADTSTCSGDTYIRLYDAAGAEVATNDDACGVCSSIGGAPSGLSACETWTLQQGCWADAACSGQATVTQYTFTGDDDTYGGGGMDDGGDDVTPPADDDPGYCFPPDMVLGAPLGLDAYHKTTLSSFQMLGQQGGEAGGSSLFGEEGFLSGAVTGGALVFVIGALVAGVVKISRGRGIAVDKSAAASGDRTIDETESGVHLLTSEMWSSRPPVKKSRNDITTAKE